MDKIKNFLANITMLHCTIAFALLVALLTVIIFLTQWKAPVTLEDEQDRNDIQVMLQELHPNMEISNVELKKVIIESTVDSIFKVTSYPDDILENITMTVYYDAVCCEGKTIHYTTIFEVDNAFLKKRVGKPLITIKDMLKPDDDDWIVIMDK